MDTYTIEPVGQIETRHGAKDGYVLRRNGTAIMKATLADVEREKVAREANPGHNPLAGINGRIG